MWEYLKRAALKPRITDRSTGKCKNVPTQLVFEQTFSPTPPPLDRLFGKYSLILSSHFDFYLRLPDDCLRWNRESVLITLVQFRVCSASLKMQSVLMKSLIRIKIDVMQCPCAGLLSCSPYFFKFWSKHKVAQLGHTPKFRGSVRRKRSIWHRCCKFDCSNWTEPASEL